MRDDLGAAREVGKALASAGHRRVVIVAGVAEARVADRGATGWRTA
jgi:DNA-binding LacI/PurR family transcriptional regulator